MQAVTVTPVTGAVVGALAAYLQGNLLKVNAVLNLTGLTFVNNDTLMTITGYKALGRTDCWAFPESGNGLVKAVIMNNSNEIKISAVSNCKLTGFAGFYDFSMVIPVIPA